jgi:hypothetical protein
MLFLLAACSTSPESLEAAAKGKPGVVSVVARENEGDDAIPFEKIPKTTEIVMEPDATVALLLAVFDEYDGEVDDGDVEGITVALGDSNRATLSTGEGIHATDRMLEELVEAGHDDEVIGYRREAFPVVPSVSLTLVPVGFNEFVSVADRFRNLEGIDDVGVHSGAFVFVWNIDGDQARFAARQQLAQMVDHRFGLTGAVVSGRGPLKLLVAPDDREAVGRCVARTPSPMVGKVIVGAKVQPRQGVHY